MIEFAGIDLSGKGDKLLFRADLKDVLRLGIELDLSRFVPGDGKASDHDGILCYRVSGNILRHALIDKSSLSDNRRGRGEDIRRNIIEVAADKAGIRKRSGLIERGNMVGAVIDVVVDRLYRIRLDERVAVGKDDYVVLPEQVVVMLKVECGGVYQDVVVERQIP